jgi:predicted DNA-binding helix-hairpin-helix protein
MPIRHCRGKSPPLVREHRLYQADWLLRFYGFNVSEIIVRPDMNLELDIDPKLAWALAHREYFPVDVNRANREQLLRIPGIGGRSVKRILSIRRHKRIRTDDLKKLRVAWKRARSFVVTEDHNPALSALDADNLRELVMPVKKQLTLFDTFDAALKGEL